MKKILFILHYPPPVHGAAMVGKFIKDSALINKKFTCDYINLGTASSLTEIGKGGKAKIFRLIYILITVFKHLVKNKYNLCYMTLNAKGAGFYKDVLVVLLLKLANRNIIYHFHNKGVSKNSNGFWKGALYRFVFKNTKSILLSPHLFKDIELFVKKEDVFYCPNGIPDDSYLLPVKKNNIPCRLLFLSNMMEQKGVYILLQACSILKMKGHLFYCDFVGGWSDILPEQFTNEIKKLKLDKFVAAHGPKYETDKYQFLIEADIFILPTYNECFPLVLLEAMQYGLPVISTCEGGIPDIVTDNETGFIVPQHDPVELANKIEILITNSSLRNEMGKNASDKFKEKFTLGHFENNLINILETAAN